MIGTGDDGESLGVTHVAAESARGGAGFIPLQATVNRGEHSGDLLARIALAYPTMSPLMQRIARDIERNASTLAIDRIQSVAARCAAHPSAIVRFARLFGYDGFRSFRDVFRFDGGSLPDTERIPDDAWRSWLSDRVEQTCAGLLTWLHELDDQTVVHAGGRLERAGRIRIAGTPSALPVCHFMLCALVELGRPAELVWSSRNVGPVNHQDDVWMLIGLRDRCPIFNEIVDRIRQTNVPVVALVDRNVSWHADPTWDLLISPQLGESDYDGIAGAITLCGALVAVTSQHKPSTEIDIDTF
ncbi:MurR/RpiR family transcriptional regulator [Burkholderia sp. SCN-KJ]|uniref:MurR/RpiR family transcriptional regulator n=1 Tax=Burkholderia sp. SCN-KJ TaxID=2969248 RepID=UPI00214FABA7|nr:MurR/RpiR family transcriptional regulator [Burkholderia sp. SCN-KJ]MCR4467885.1 MurR/RpiR family transcriptional regulator [Burkholderia sp. SCN-KJ]